MSKVKKFINFSFNPLQVTITVYNMAAVDFNTFFTAFVPHFLQNMDGLDTDQRTTLKENFKTDTVSIHLNR